MSVLQEATQILVQTFVISQLDCCVLPVLATQNAAAQFSSGPSYIQDKPHLSLFKLLLPFFLFQNALEAVDAV